MFITVFIERKMPPWAFYIIFIERENKFFFIANCIYQFLLCYEMLLFSLLVENPFIVLMIFIVNRFQFLHKIVQCLDNTNDDVSVNDNDEQNTKMDGKNSDDKQSDRGSVMKKIKNDDVEVNGIANLSTMKTFLIVHIDLIR